MTAVKTVDRVRAEEVSHDWPKRPFGLVSVTVGVAVNPTVSMQSMLTAFRVVTLTSITIHSDEKLQPKLLVQSREMNISVLSVIWSNAIHTSSCTIIIYMHAISFSWVEFCLSRGSRFPSSIKFSQIVPSFAIAECKPDEMAILLFYLGSPRWWMPKMITPKNKAFDDTRCLREG